MNRRNKEGFRKIDNELFQAIMSAKLTGAGYQVILKVIDETKGFQRKEAKIPLSRFQRDTGLSRQSILKGIKHAEERHIIKVERDATKPCVYGLNNPCEWLASQPNHPNKLVNDITLNWATKSPQTRKPLEPRTADIKEILKENKGKAGVYMFLHKESKKRYVGSAKNLRKRFMQYFNPNHLKRQDYMYICRAILKHGFPHFTLVVIEYCDSKLCINRENYYITYFKPEYNILPLAGSLSGFKHSLTTREKMSISQKAFDRVGDKNPRFGSVVSESTRLKLSLAAKDRFKEIDVLDLTTNETTRYESTHAAARALGILQGRIANYF